MGKEPARVPDGREAVVRIPAQNMLLWWPLVTRKRADNCFYLVFFHAAAERADFSTDSYMLDYFEQTLLGFNSVARIGSVMQVQLRDLVERGFGAFIAGGGSHKRQALMASLRAFIAAQCHACYEAMPINSPFVGCCQSCDRRYCSDACMRMDDLSELS